MYNFQIKAYKPEILAKYTGILKKIFGYFTLGPITVRVLRLPKIKRGYTLLKSPHVNKTAREQFETVSYSHRIYVYGQFITVKSIPTVLRKQTPASIKLNYTLNSVI
jgi:small subunit ribosomal protein S10